MSKRLVVLAISDVILSVLGTQGAYLLRFGEILRPAAIHFQDGVKVSVFSVITVFFIFLVEMYSDEKHYNRKDILARVGLSYVGSFLVLSAIFYMMPEVKFGRGVFILSLAVSAWFHLSSHLAYGTFICSPGLARRVLVLGTGPLAQKIGTLITMTNHKHVLCGYVGMASEPVTVPAHAIVNNGHGLAETVQHERANKIVVSLSEQRGVFPIQDVLKCKFSGIEIVDAPSFYEELTGKLIIENIKPSWFIFSDGFRITTVTKLCKRLFDVTVSVIGMICTSPLMAITGLLIKLDSPGSVFFRQERVGEKDENFILYKFRTMRQDAESKTGAVWAQKNDPRVTRVGKVLRKTRLDELPQFYNVLRGDMSLVGPRPERPEFVEKLKAIIPYYSERHFVKPGVTGWAQVKYSYGASVEDAIEKLRYDLYYIKNISLSLDLLVIIETVKIVLFGRGAR